MNDIIFENVYKSYGHVEVIKDMNLKINDGERIVLLGPSGCGKSTMLRMIAGLEDITSGNLYMSGRRVNDVEPGERNVAMVFQNYALYPHMTVAKNITFGMEIAKVPKSEQKRNLEWALQILGLEDYASRLPRELSGGQRQRVALCRALVKKAPFFLLDEPLSNLDAQLRTSARAELVKVHQVYNPTFVYVTHDQVEAMTIGQRIVVLEKSIIQQEGTPDEVYNRPRNTFVAKFIGSPSMNIADVYIDRNELIIGNHVSEIPSNWIDIIGDKKEIKMGIRPEHITFSYEPAENAIPIKITYTENHGNRICITFDIANNNKMIAMVDTDVEITDHMFMNLVWSKMHFFDNESTLNLGYPQKM